jgi:hypothetical protein
MPNINYTTKDKNATDGIKNKFRDIDANEVKTAVNSKLSGDLVVFDTTLVTNIISIDVGNESGKFYKGSANIIVAKTWQFLNYANARYIPGIRFNVLVGVQQTFPNNVKMPDSRWNSGTKQWKAEDSGDYEATATYDGTTWTIKISDVLS